MENNELINIWNTLAENKLIGNNLAKEQISSILKKKHSEVVHNIKRKVLFDCSLYLTISILVPLVSTIASLNSPISIEPIHLFGIIICEAYLLFMLIKAYGKYQRLDNNTLTSSLKESIQNLRTQYLKILNKERLAAYIFAYLIIGFSTYQYIILFNSNDLNKLSTWIAPIVIALTMPLILHFEYKLRYRNSVKQFDDTLLSIDKIE